MAPLIILAILLVLAGVLMPAMLIAKATIVDGSMSAGAGFVLFLGLLAFNGLIWQSQGTVWMFVLIAGLLAFCIALPKLSAKGESRELREMQNEDIAKFQAAFAADPANATACGFLADAYRERGQYLMAIPAYEKAIALRPNSEQTIKWRRHLKESQDAKAGVVGHRDLNFEVCPNCQQDAPAHATVCPRCGATLQMTFAKWLAQPENYKAVAQATVSVMLVLAVLLAIFSVLPVEIKACVAVAAVIMGAYYFLRGIGPNGGALG